jgi:membrane-bound metal-dependent hydrolase YbcI (DUF457 family)
VDLFTHVLFAYLLSFVLWGPAAPQYIAAGALAGGLPDADILLFPLARRFPRLQHRGIVHTVLGVTVIAGIGAFLLPYLPYFPLASTLRYFVAMEVGGLSHLVLDGFTNFAVAPLQPFSRRTLRLDADVAVSLVTIALTAGALVVLALERGTVAFSVWTETVWILVGIYGGYLVLRTVARARAVRAAHRAGYRTVLPTTTPWRWLLVDEEDSPARYRLRYRRLTLGSADAGTERSMEVTKGAGDLGPVATAQAALDRTYGPALARSARLAVRYPFGVAEARGTGYHVTWYAVGIGGFGRTFGVEGEVDRATGAMRLRSGFIREPPSARDEREGRSSAAQP